MSWHIPHLASSVCVSVCAFCVWVAVVQSMLPLDIDAEMKLLRNSLRSTGRAVSVRVMCATASNLSVAVVLGCSVLHFSGHGDVGLGLAFEDGCGRAHWLPANKLHSLLCPSGDGHDTPIKLVVVSSCKSEAAAQAFLAAGVRHVVAIATDSLLNDVSAQYFTQNFYLALAAGKTVRAAFDAGVAAVRCSSAHLHVSRVSRNVMSIYPAHRPLPTHALSRLLGWKRESLGFRFHVVCMCTLLSAPQVATAPVSRTGSMTGASTVEKVVANKFLLLPACPREPNDFHAVSVLGNTKSGRVQVDGYHRSNMALPEHFIGRRYGARPVPW